MDRIVVPGTRLGGEEEYQSGRGTYCIRGVVYSSLLGRCHLEQTAPLPTVVVDRPSAASDIRAEHIQKDDVILGQVVSTCFNSAELEILCVNDKALDKSLAGLIRVGDIREFEVESIRLDECFRCGDIVKAVVLGMGPMQNVLLSTSGNEYGVVLARSPAGLPLVPISWNEMQCPQTREIFPRKVAKC